jgi:putative endonuclease
MSDATSSWFVYIVRCSDGTLYTGITTDTTKRVAAHNSKRGAKYTATRTPVTLVWSQPSETRSTASKEEWRIKQLSRSEKLSLIGAVV